MCLELISTRMPHMAGSHCGLLQGFQHKQWRDCLPNILECSAENRRQPKTCGSVLMDSMMSFHRCSSVLGFHVNFRGVVQGGFKKSQLNSRALQCPLAPIALTANTVYPRESTCPIFEVSGSTNKAVDLSWACTCRFR